MGIWEILGIERTADIAAIKTAYAAMAKKYHPEEHPEEFQRLQKAYRSALQYAKMISRGRQEPGEPETEQPKTEKPEAEEPETKKPGTEEPKTEEPEAEEPKTGEPETEEPKTEKPEAEKPETEKPKTENPEQLETEKAEESGQPEETEEAGKAGQEKGRQLKEGGESKEAEEPEKAEKPHKTEQLKEGERPEEGGESEQAGEPEETQQLKENGEPFQNHLEQNLGMTDSYDYEAVEATDTAAQFWDKLEIFVFHPYLRNNIACWQYFLEQPAYKELFRDIRFRMKFAAFISGQCRHNWHQHTVRFLDEYLKGFQKNKTNICETDTPDWKNLLKKARISKSLLTSPCATEEEWELYRVLWGRSSDRDERKNPGEELWDGEQIRQYLTAYFFYASGQRDRLEEVYRRASRARQKRFYRRRFMGVFLICAYFAVMAMGIREVTRPPYDKMLRERADEYKRTYWTVEEQEKIQAEFDIILEKYYE